MTDQHPTDGPAETTGVPAEVVEAARARLAEWLTAQAPTPELGATPEELADWAVRPAEEFLVFIPPGYANQLFLVAEDGISSFAPSTQTLDDAIAAARSQS